MVCLKSKEMSMPFRSRITNSASEDRLETLLLERLKSGSNKPEIDQRIWDLFGEKWAVMVTDLAGFSKGSEKWGIVHFLQTILESHRLLIPLIDEHDGILVKTEADSLLVIFRNPEKALHCAVAMQKMLAIYNQSTPLEEQVNLCVGLGYGDILRIGDSDVFDVEVNAASKLGEDMAKAEEILVTAGLVNAISSGWKHQPITTDFGLMKEAYRILWKD